MSLILRGFHFRGGVVVGSFSHLDPTTADSRRIDRHVEPGDVIYVIDDELSMGDFDALGQETVEGRYSEADVRAVATAIEEHVAPDFARGSDDMLVWTKVGRAPGSFSVRRDETKNQRVPASGIHGRVVAARAARKESSPSIA